MNFQEKIKFTIEKLTEQKATVETEVAKLEDDFANVKLNPYGITSIDFNKRQELNADLLKMEGTLMGLQLALETFEETSAE